MLHHLLFIHPTPSSAPPPPNPIWRCEAPRILYGVALEIIIDQRQAFTHMRLSLIAQYRNVTLIQLECGNVFLEINNDIVKSNIGIHSISISTQTKEYSVALRYI